MFVKTIIPYNKKPCFEHYQPLFALHNAQWKVFVALDMWVKTIKPYNKNHVLNTINHFLHCTMLNERYLWLWICCSKQSNPITKTMFWALPTTFCITQCSMKGICGFGYVAQNNQTLQQKPCFEHYQPLFASHNAQWKVFVSSKAEGRGVY